ncbi:shikimate dehydrogenase [Actinocrispum wychmicini]|uniref:Shikimate dehydrogenase n=1 Tax=Actinocrispum wychmicini TaxID=1213861 RepID=A0A4R2IVW4_9PSEU|nr:shikimate dehydrogenase [Actinocrispum wychmicini]TCO49863.1 shikimate dehydrogenase [Actinocrispum wychmicini]
MASSKASVVGKPIAHSLSPVLHSAAYEALGLTEWTYSRIEADDTELPGLVAGLGPEWMGLSVTMPGKFAALSLADSVTDRASLVGAANTLVRTADGWRADCTDVDGVVGALVHGGGFQARPDARAVLLGAGGTALAALVALASLEVSSFALVLRDPAKSADVSLCAERLGVKVDVLRWADTSFEELAADADVLVSTVPGSVADPYAEDLARASCVLDVIYHPWPTRLASAVQARGGRIGTGLDMLLYQAFGQVEQFTGRPAPRDEMRNALSAATGMRLA